MKNLYLGTKNHNKTILQHYITFFLFCNTLKLQINALKFHLFRVFIFFNAAFALKNEKRAVYGSFFVPSFNFFAFFYPF